MGNVVVHGREKVEEEKCCLSSSFFLFSHDFEKESLRDFC